MTGAATDTRDAGAGRTRPPRVRNGSGRAGSRSVSSIYICLPVCKTHENIHACFVVTAPGMRRGECRSVPQEEMVLVGDLLVLLETGLRPLRVGVRHRLQQRRA